MEGDLREEKVGKRYFVAPLIILLALVYIGFLLYQAVYVNYQTNKKISALNAALKENKVSRQNLEVLIAYYKTSAFQELEARKKLGLKLPGEKVVKVEVPDESRPRYVEEEQVAAVNKKSNIEHWVDYLFYPDL